MPKITWIKISFKKYGGTIYGEKAMAALSKVCQVEAKNIVSGRLFSRYLKPLEWLWGLVSLKGQSDLWIRDDFYAIALQIFDRTRGRKMAVVYHIDSSTFPWPLRPFVKLIEKIFYWQVKKNNAVLTIADYWRTHFLAKDCRRVYKISPAFDLSQFDVAEEEVEQFKKKYGFSEKPIVYLGNCQKAKGAVEAYKALNDLDVHLVTSGREQVKIPARNMNFSYREYLTLLKASVVVITMSKFNEGWCMTSHEAMLLSTPVIGSGKGGMKELLEGGKQIICQDFKELKAKVEDLLSNPQKREELGKSGYQFAKTFTLERFEKEWLEVVKDLKIC